VVNPHAGARTGGLEDAVRKRIVATALILAGGIAAAAGVWWTVARAAPRREQLVVASVRQPATALLFFARATGCLADEGVVLDEHVFELGRDALVLLRDGRADVAVAFETPALRAAFADPRVRILSSLHRSAEHTRIVARRDRGVTRTAELVGRRVGVTFGTNAEFFLDTLLRFEGVRRSDVIVLNVSPEAALDGLTGGDLDAIAIFDPYGQRAEARLGRNAVVIKTELYLEASLLTTRDDVIRTRRPALEALLRGLACAERRARERPATIVPMLRDRLPGFTDAELGAQLARVQWGLGLDHVLVDLLRREREWLDQYGAPGSPPDLARVVEPQLLEAVAPDAVLLLPRG
jgi:ABC-type nitrate/sulfonate/bicarbonate transport system substrate-binding protein